MDDYLRSVSYDGEIWKQIDGYSKYFVSTHGRICSFRRSATRPIILSPNEDCALTKDSDKSVRYFRVSRLVAKHFMSDFNENMCVVHADGDKLNNCVDNLVLVDDEEAAIKYYCSHKVTDLQQVSDKISSLCSEGESWAAIKNFSRYYISSKGRILSTCKNEYKLLKLDAKANQYISTSLVDDSNKLVEVFVHREVMRAFSSDFDPMLTVNHKDGNKHNNDISNLEMMTTQDNTAHYYASDQFVDSRRRRSAKLSAINKGKVWVNNGSTRTLINRSDIDSYVSLGYELGMR